MKRTLIESLLNMVAQVETARALSKASRGNAPANAGMIELKNMTEDKLLFSKFNSQTSSVGINFANILAGNYQVLNNLQQQST